MLGLVLLRVLNTNPRILKRPRAPAADVRAMRQAITCGDGLSAEIRCRVFLPPLATRAADRRVRESGVDQETDGFHGVVVVKWSPEEVTVKKREWREGGENSRDGSDAKLLGVL